MKNGGTLQMGSPNVYAAVSPRPYGDVSPSRQILNGLDEGNLPLQRVIQELGRPSIWELDNVISLPFLVKEKRRRRSPEDE
jgi:hypothetical protein